VSAIEGDVVTNPNSPKLRSAVVNAKLHVLMVSSVVPLQISLHTFYCLQNGGTRKFEVTSDRDRVVKKREIVREMLIKT
jgi:hypothetical protein